jgi:hypothetical protein
MKKRYTVLALSVVFALALAVPALGGPTNPIASVSASVKSIATKALKKAKAAQNTANSALSAANAAQNDANSAKNEATSASKAAKTAQTTANEAKTAAATAQSTANNALSVANSKLKTTEFVAGSFTESNTTAFKIAASECPAGSVVTGGGYEVGGTQNQVTVGSEQSAFYGPGWLVTANSISGMTPTWSLKAIAVCAKP